MAALPILYVSFHSIAMRWSLVAVKSLQLKQPENYLPEPATKLSGIPLITPTQPMQKREGFNACNGCFFVSSKRYPADESNRMPPKM
jgi:hypothetical protein